jgi:hypothetical protein
MSDMAMVTSKRLEKPMFFETQQLAKDSVVVSCHKLKLVSLTSEFPETVYKFAGDDGLICDVITVTQILDSMVLDHVEHL